MGKNRSRRGFKRCRRELRLNLKRVKNFGLWCLCLCLAPAFANECGQAVEPPPVKVELTFKKSLRRTLLRRDQTAIAQCLDVAFSFGIPAANDNSALQIICIGAENASRFEVTYRVRETKENPGIEVENALPASRERQIELWTTLAERMRYQPFVFRLSETSAAYFGNLRRTIIRVMPPVKAELDYLQGFEDSRLIQVLSHIRHPVPSKDGSFSESVVIGPDTYALTFARQGRRIYLTSAALKYETHPHRYGGRKLIRAATPVPQN